MSGDAVIASAPGFYGKIPSRGDFVSRRLPREFITRWDGWLQQGMRDFQARHGEAWLRYYLDSPVWRFALAPGVCTKDAWAGILMPSVDRVGRHFPLTIAQTIEQVASVNELLGQNNWFAELEASAMASRSDHRDLAQLDEDLLTGNVLQVGAFESLLQPCDALQAESADHESFCKSLDATSDRAWWWCKMETSCTLTSAKGLDEDLLSQLLLMPNHR